MHTERYRVPAETMARLPSRPARVVAVGTTTVRALETAAATGVLEGTERPVHPARVRFAVVDVLLTNFHLPRSTPPVAPRGVLRPPVAGPVSGGARPAATASSPSGTP